MKNFKVFKASVLCGTALILGYASPAFADDAPTAADKASAAASTDAGDIIVTAQRKAQFARDVPISITALNGPQLSKAGIVDSVSLGNITPGLRMDRIGNFTIPAIRGITSTITGPGADNNVAIYLDGVYQPEATVNNFDLPDVERVEVLKGPQGTLFGRNATGGAIQVFTKTPSFKTEGNASLSYGSYHDVEVKGYVSTPLIDDKVALSVATSYRKADSYNTDIGYAFPGDINKGSRREGVDSKLFRAKLLIKPTDTIKILLTGLYSDHLDNSGNFGVALNGNSAATLDFTGSHPAIIPTKPWTMASDSNVYQRSKVTSLSGKIEAEVGNGTLSSLTSWSEFINLSLLDSDYAQQTNGGYANFQANSVNRNLTEEVNFVSHNSGKLNYTLGVFYSNGWAGWDNLGLRSYSPNAPIPAACPGGEDPCTPSSPSYVAAHNATPADAYGLDIYGHQKITSYAAFGEVYYDITDKLKVIVGARYTHEKRSLTRSFTGANIDPAFVDYAHGLYGWNPAGNPTTANSFTPRASIKYDVTPHSNVYFSFSEGFKSGVFDATSPAAQPSVNPEKLYAYELGYKGRVAPWLTLSAAAYYYRYKDIQIVYFVDGGGGLPLAKLGNVGGANIKGLEADANFTPSRHFDGRIGLNYLNTSYHGFAAASVQVPNGQTYCTADCSTGSPVQGHTLLGTADLTGTHTEGFNANGYSLIHAPNFTIYATANYHADLAGGILDLSATLYHSSTVNFTFDHRVNQPAWETVDGRIAWTPANDRFTFSVIGKNLTNKAVIAGTFIQAAADGVSYAPPRTFAAQLDVRF